MVKAYARTINLVDGCNISELKQHLREVWPEVLVAWRDIGILKAKQFVAGNTMMIQYFECDDNFDPTSFDSWITTDERCLEWSQMMQKYEQPCEAANQAEGEWWKDMEEMLCFETQF